MPEQRTLKLGQQARIELAEVRDCHEKPHRREKAAAFIKIADGMSINQVAKEGLLKRRAWVTVQG